MKRSFFKIASLVTVAVIAQTAYAVEADGGSARVMVTALNTLDRDGDGLTDEVERMLGTDELNLDTDNDGMPDGFEAFNSLSATNKGDAKEDADNDGLVNLSEFKLGTNPFDADSDADGWGDGLEAARGADPADAGNVPYQARVEDIDADGKVSAMDIQLVMNAALGGEVLAPTNVNKTNMTDAADIQQVVNAALNN